MKLPIGYDNFQEIISNKLDYVDKTLFIKDIIDDSAKVVLIARPRRFGKTLNLSMLRYFLASEVYGESTQGLFDGLKIKSESKEYLQHQGHYPVVFISFKDVKSNNYKTAYASLCKLISRIYQEHQPVLLSDKISNHQKKIFESILEERATEASIQSSLLDLSQLLYTYHGVKPWLLIDEYDTPIQSAYLGGYYEEMIGLIRGMFGAALKTNPYLYKAVLTGILRISKESLFSELNNIKVYSMLNARYGNYFGFTEPEITTLLTKSALSVSAEAIRSWYNGYQMGETTVYNPWSIVNCIQEGGILKPYWVNTSDNALIKTLLIKSSAEFKEQLEILLDDQPIEKIIDENFVYGDLMGNKSAVWSLLLMTGYLKVTSNTETEQGFNCFVKIPNREVRSLYRQIIEQWLSNGYGVDFYNQFLRDLLRGHTDGVNGGLACIMEQTASVYDLSKEPEAFYHGLLLGLIASLDRAHYELKSNRESGAGRYDIAIIPKDVSTPGIILELKRFVKLKGTEKEIEVLLEQNAREALKQIEQRNYVAEFKSRNIQRLIKMGLAFSGKQFKLLSEEVPL